MNQAWKNQGCSSCRSSWERDAGKSLEHITTSVKHRAHLRRCENCGALWMEEERYANEVSAEKAKSVFENSELLAKYASRPLCGSALLEAINAVCNASGSEAEINQLMHQIKRSVPHPNVSDLIFWPRDNPSPSAEEIASEALNYHVIAL